jgi:hypothetical protein
MLCIRTCTVHAYLGHVVLASLLVMRYPQLSKATSEAYARSARHIRHNTSTAATATSSAARVVSAAA